MPPATGDVRTGVKKCLSLDPERRATLRSFLEAEKACQVSVSVSLKLPGCRGIRRFCHFVKLEFELSSYYAIPNAATGIDVV